MKLGKRYIAIVEHPTMPHWEDYAAPELYKSEALAAAVKDDAKLRHCGCDYEHAGHVIEIDLDDSKRRNESPEEAYARNERVMLAACAEVERLKPIVSVKVGCEVEVEAEPVADITFEPWPPRRQGGQQVGVSAGIIAIHRPTGTAVIRSDERSQYANKQAAIAELRKIVDRTRASLTNAERLAFRDLYDQASRMLSVDRKSGPLAGTRPHINGDLASMVSALRKLAAVVNDRCPCNRNPHEDWCDGGK